MRIVYVTADRGIPVFAKLKLQSVERKLRKKFRI